MYRREIEKWLNERERYPDMKTGFFHAFPGEMTDYLVIPEIHDVKNGRAALIYRWNGLLLDLFSRTGYYRREDADLCRELERFLEALEQWESGQYSETEYELKSHEPGIEETVCIGREEELSRIDTMLSEYHTVLLHGLGGMGKSTVARAYAKQYREKYRTVVFASCESGLQQLLGDDTQISIRGLAYNPSGKRGELGWYCRKKLQILAEITDEKTLLILDNLDQYEAEYLERLRKLPCRLLITTRRRPADELEHALAVLPLRIEEQMVLFERYYGKKVSGEIRRTMEDLVKNLGGNTLRIKQLGLYCAKEQEIRTGDLMAFGKEETPIFRLDTLAAGEQKVLRNAVLLPLKGIGMNDFLACGGRMTKRQLESLISLGLVEYNASEQRIFLHPLVKEEASRLLKPGWYTCQSYIRRFVEKLEDFWNFTREQKGEASDYILSLLKQLPEFDARCTREIFALTDLIWQIGQWEFALKYTKRLYEFCKKQLGEAHPDTAEAAHLIGTVYHNRNKCDQAARWYCKAWKIYERTEKKDPVLEGRYGMKYSRYLLLHGAYGEMEEMFDYLEDLYRKALRSEKDEKKRCSLEMGCLNFYIQQERSYQKMGEWEKSLAICEQAERFHRETKDGLASKAYICLDKSNCLKQLGRYEEAVCNLEEARNIADQYFLSGCYVVRQSIDDSLVALMKIGPQ